ncbi:MAG: hypothetical protein KDD66_13905 [Bdellovibrionales bacterium]|nr:hypothetical protein [Bdellovibrionales bacterium]
MGTSRDKDEEELDKLYPKGTREREILDYSRSSNPDETVPPMLLAAFRVLMGVTAVMAIVSIIAFASH